jgi:hypothetical protein
LRQNYFAELADTIIRVAERHDLVVLIDQTNGTREGETGRTFGERSLDSPKKRVIFTLTARQEGIACTTFHIQRVLFWGESMLAGQPTITMHNVRSRARSHRPLDRYRASRIALNRRTTSTTTKTLEKKIPLPRLRAIARTLEAAGSLRPRTGRVPPPPGSARTAAPAMRCPP